MVILSLKMMVKFVLLIFVDKITVYLNAVGKAGKLK